MHSLRRSSGNAYGALVAWVGLLIIVNVPSLVWERSWPAIVVGVTVFFLVIVASIDLLSVVPANVYGYAALVAYSLPQPSAAAGHRPHCRTWSRPRSPTRWSCSLSRW